MGKLLAVVVLVACVGTGVAVAQSEEQPNMIPISENALWPEDLATAPDGTKYDPNDYGRTAKPGEPTAFIGPDGEALVCPGKSEPVKIKHLEPPPGIVQADHYVKPDGTEVYEVTRDAAVRCTPNGTPVWVPATAANMANRIAPEPYRPPTYEAK
jgi:hypothetical protein